MSSLRMCLVLIAMTLAFAACDSGPKDLVIVSQELKGQASASTSAASEFGASATPAGSVYWVEGKVHNGGDKDYRNVQIGFKCTDGSVKRILSVEIPLVPAGKTVAFRTRQEQTQLTLRMLDEKPDIYWER